MIKLEARKTNEFTYHYSQPEDYHFCLDSVILAEFVADRVSSNVEQLHIDENTKVLDLCAGCGVVGLELSYHLPKLRKVDFVEIQDVFAPHFRENLSRANKTDREFHFINLDLKKLSGEYDLVVANPPYFSPSRGKQSSSKIKNRCHFFIDCTLSEVVSAACRLLSDKGKAYLLVKEEFAEFEEVKKSFPHVYFEFIAEIRGTKVLRLKKAAGA